MDLKEALKQIFSEGFRGRILSFDSNSAAAFAKIAVGRRALGRPIAAIARSHAAVVATRNTADFEGCGVRVEDPWTES